MRVRSTIRSSFFAAFTLMAQSAYADQVILDDLIVDGSACVGQDCSNGESFGFDTLRLKENNLRIKFEDTSNSASFPTNDWQLTANDSSNGGQNKFSIDDVTNSRTPFTIEGSAPSNSLYVDDGGRVGLGTNTPVVELHIKNGDSPTVRLEQDGSSGFTPQTWDMAANEANFFVRDATNGSRLPFRIIPSAPTDSLVITADGDIGLGTKNPSGAFDVVRTGTTPTDMVFLKNGGPSRIALENTGSSNTGTWRLNHANDGVLRIADGVGVPEFQLDADGNLTIVGNIVTGGGTCGGGCDYVFDSNFELDSIEDHAEKMFSNKYLPAVGPTKENAPINLSDKTGRMLNELEKAHIYIAQLNERLAKLEKALANQK